MLSRKYRSPHWQRAIVLTLFVLATPTLAASELQAIREACNTITSGELQRHVDVLADDSFEGREAGSRGGQAAGGYLVQYFEQNGLVGAGVDGSYFQPFGNGCRNILGMIRGSDPELQDEVILVGAHYDHVGYGTRRNSFGPLGYIHNGADDNASGTAALLEVMQAFFNLPEPPRRTVVFAAWDGEEQGLLGSKHWTNYPTIPLKQLRLLINMDMLGRLRNQRVEVYGSRTSWGLRQLVCRQNTDADLNLNLDFIWDIKDNSDHHPFFAHGIPFLMFHTGLHDDYHRPRDDAEKINAEGIEQVAHLAFYVALEAAERETALEFRRDSRRESEYARRQYESSVPGAPPRLGVSWEAGDSENGLLVSRVTPGAPADLAGLRVGDRILRFNQWEVKDGENFPLLVLAAENPSQLIVERPGESDPVELQVQLAGNPVRIGIKWREDQADSGSLLLTNVAPGSAAGNAQLKVNDRVYAINGQAFSNSEEFHRLVTSVQGPIDLSVERNGQVHRTTLNLWDNVVEAVDVTPASNAD